MSTNPTPDDRTWDEEDAAVRQQLTYWRQKRTALGEQLTAFLSELLELRRVARTRGDSVRGLGDRDSLARLLARSGYTFSEPHLSGYRLVIGFETLSDVQAAHEAIASLAHKGTKL